MKLLKLREVQSWDVLCIRSMSWIGGLLALVRDSYSWSCEIFRGGKWLIGSCFSSFIHRVFQFRGSSRRIRCRDSSGAFVPWVSVLLLLFQSRWSSASWPLSRPIRFGGDPRGPPLLQIAFPAVSWSVLEYFLRNTMEHREVSLFAGGLLPTSFNVWWKLVCYIIDVRCCSSVRWGHVFVR